VKHIVMRKFGGTKDGGDFTFTPGMEVDATGWKHEQLLIEQHKIMPIPGRAPTRKEMARPGRIARLAAQLAPPTTRKQTAVKEIN